jgi:hypothetical protein
LLQAVDWEQLYIRLGLSETDLELIKLGRYMCAGQSAKHKQELGLPELNENTAAALTGC